MSGSKTPAILEERIIPLKLAQALACAAILLSAVAAPGQAETYTYEDLVNKLVDLEGLAELPEPGTVGAQASSYHRVSRYDEATGKYLEWDANWDGDGFIRNEGDRQVWAELEGPGVIWRIWSAHAAGGAVHVYLDGAEEPAISMPFTDYFNGTRRPFTYPALVHTTARGLNNYVPIPFQKSCKIVADKDWGAYFHFTYQQFPQGTRVPTFTMDLPLKDEMALAKVDSILQNRLGEDPAGHRAGQRTITKNINIAPGQTQTLASIRGPRAITGIRAELDAFRSPDAVDILRSAVLKITWDNEASAAVWVPLGDFFGTAPGVNDHTSLPLGLKALGAYSYWYMPFGEQAVVELINESRKPIKGAFQFTHAPLDKPLDTLGRFHAKWHRDAFLPEDPERRAIDWTMLVTEGRGRYAGVMLEVWNPLGGWWGEGDEKFYVDGENFPSTYGTGSEDYFGYAWCDPQLFQHAFHNQTISQGNRGHISVNRWHIADNVPFQTSFEAAIEKYFPNDRPTLYASTVYWYLEPGGEDPYGAVPLGERTGWYRGAKTIKVKGALEGEDLKVEEVAGGRTSLQEMGAFGDGWSGLMHLWWTENKPGKRLTVNFPVGTSGSYEVLVNLTKARDYGIVQMHVDGTKAGDPVDLFSPDVRSTGEISLGRFDLDKGTHQLTLEIVGAHPDSLKQYMAGLDYIRLQK